MLFSFLEVAQTWRLFSLELASHTHMTEIHQKNNTGIIGLDFSKEAWSILHESRDALSERL